MKLRLQQEELMLRITQIRFFKVFLTYFVLTSTVGKYVEGQKTCEEHNILFWQFCVYQSLRYLTRLQLIAILSRTFS